MRIYITEKPHSTEQIGRALAQDDLQEDILFIEANSFWLNSSILPRHLKISDYPFFETPRYRPEAFFYGREAYVKKLTAQGAVKHAQLKTFEDISTYLSKADQIICACDTDYMGAWAFDQFIEHGLGPQRAESYPVLKWNYRISVQTATWALNPEHNTESAWFQALVQAGRAKRLLEHNFNINSFAILGHLHRTLTGEKIPDFSMGKYALQALYWLSDAGATHAWVAAEKMQKGWHGTGRYDQTPLMHLSGLGSAASRHEIIRSLLKLKLVSETSAYLLSITPLGTAFLERLHKDCRDPDLPFRLDQWMQAGEAASHDQIRKYIRTFFGKQLRHQSRTLHETTVSNND